VWAHHTQIQHRYPTKPGDTVPVGWRGLGGLIWGNNVKQFDPNNPHIHVQIDRSS